MWPRGDLARTIVRGPEGSYGTRGWLAASGTLFKEYTGRSFVTFLRDIKITKAKELLTN